MDITKDQTDMFSVIATDAVAPVAELSLDDKVRNAIDNLKAKMSDGYSFLVATSFGKDSSVLLAIALQALKEQVEEQGSAPQMVVCHANTRVENPLISAHGLKEAERVTKFIKAHNLPARMDLVMPNLSNHYFLQMIGGRTIATFPDNSNKCSDMMKVNPIQAHKRAVFKEFGQENVITLIGKRRDESAERSRNMEANGENAMEAVLDKNDSLVLSAIADFTLDDIFWFIANVRNERFKTYSDFEDLMEVYRDLNAGECAINVYAQGKSSASGCGARSGCFICLKVANDTSMEGLLEREDYAWMKPLNDLRNLIGAEHYNPSSRTWLSRSVQEDGTIVIAPNAYSPEFCEDLLRHTLTIQIEEEEAAWDLGLEQPRFGILSLSDIIAIEILWARYGYHTTFKACEIYDDIYNKGSRYPVPPVTTVWPNSALPNVGTKAPFADADYSGMFSGFRDVEAAAAGAQNEVEKNGSVYTNANTDGEFSIDEEGAAMFFEYELDYVLERFNGLTPTAVYHYFVRLGVVTLNKGGHSEQDRMLRMANQIHRLSLRPVLNDPVALLARLEEHFGSGSATGGNFQVGLFAEAA